MGRASIRARHNKQRACTGKEGRYDTLEEAEDAARRWMDRNPGSLPRVGYPCSHAPKGDHFHFGKRLGSGKPPRRQRRI